LADTFPRGQRRSVLAIGGESRVAAVDGEDDAGDVTGQIA
jgi:hypothetical protein